MQSICPGFVCQPTWTYALHCHRDKGSQPEVICFMRLNWLESQEQFTEQTKATLELLEGQR